MKIGIIGSGFIGGALARKLSAAGHQVKIANSRAPETIDAKALTSGATAVWAKEAVRDVDVVILSVPLAKIDSVAPLLADLPKNATVIDTSNYYPHRDGKIDELEAGEIESIWVSKRLGRPLVKAWNAIYTASFDTQGRPSNAASRIALPIAADSEQEYEIARELVDATGFDAYYSGPLSESWRQQPGAPVYCTDLSRAELPGALASAKRERLPELRDATIRAFVSHMESEGGDLSSEWTVATFRSISARQCDASL